MKIIIYRTKMSYLIDAFVNIANELTKREIHKNHNIRIDSDRMIIDVDTYQISFWTGEVWRMSGIIPKYYNADSIEASNVLMKSATKVDGCEITIDEMINLWG